MTEYMPDFGKVSHQAIKTSVLVLAVLLTACAVTDDPASMRSQGTGQLEQVRVFGPALAGNLEGDDATRDVFVYLPAGYDSNPDKRYPVVYFLHGYGANAQRYVGLLDLPAAIDAVMGEGVKDMIVVLPDAFSAYSGSMYSNSPTTGDWEAYIARDLVGWIDSNFRTLAKRESRGLAGHSMGGYGTLRIGMKHPEVFGALYAMSSCCLMNRAPGREQVEQQVARMAEGPVDPADGFGNVLQAQAAAWAPNPQNPPYFFDWPWQDGEARPDIQAKWAANSPLVMVDQYVPALNSFRALFIDVGDADTLAASNHQLNDSLTRLGVSHGFEEYEGDHGNRVAERFQANVLEFFHQYLDEE